MRHPPSTSTADPTLLRGFRRYLRQLIGLACLVGLWPGLPAIVLSQEPSTDGGKATVALILEGDPEDNLPEAETQFRERFLTTPIALSGAVWDASGRPIPGARIDLGEQVVTSSFDGSFRATGLLRANRMLQVEKAGYRTEQLAVHLFRNLRETEVTLEPVILGADSPDRRRFAFGGDTAFGRRFLDPSGSTPRGEIPVDNPDALILASDPEPGTREALRFVKPLLEAPDFTVLNLETPVTDDPIAPHPTKAFAFFTLTGSLPALQWAGVDYVSLGNNHVYDYLEPGLVDTLDSLEALDFPFSGAGLTPAEAYAPFVQAFGSSRYSLLSMNSIAGRQHDLTYVAEEVAGEVKGGAADLTNSDMALTAVRAARATGHIPIVQLHQGNEYELNPSSFILGRMDDMALAGARLIIGHHPHVAQGFGWHHGVLAAHCLGNFAFDQARLETMLGLMARVDLEGPTLRRAAGVPVYLEDFRPRPIGGRLANHLARRVAAGSALNGVRVDAANGLAQVLLPGTPYAEIERTVRLEIEIGESGLGVADLRPVLRPGESLAGGSVSDGLLVRTGKDLLLFGDLEDYDVDDLHLEAARWDVSAGSRFACLDEARGAAALCSTRSGSNQSSSVISLRNRVRVEGDAEDLPNKSVSLLLSARGEGAGSFRVRSELRASVGSAVFGGTNLIEHEGGTFPWSEFLSDVEFPPDDPLASDPTRDNARAVRLFIEHDPPDAGDGLLQLDDLAVISWGEPEPGGDFDVASPGTFDFVRLDGAPGTYTLEARLQRSAPSFECQSDELTLCLGNRFRLEIKWEDFSGSTGRGQAVPLTEDTGAFWFFDQENLELIVKVLDGSGVNGNTWVFFGSLSDTAFELSVTDLWSGEVRRYLNESGNLASRGDTAAFEGRVVKAPALKSQLDEQSFLLDAGVARAAPLELAQGRFEISVQWRDFGSGTGEGEPVALTTDTGYFWFFEENNVEVVAKVLDGRAINGHFWLFFGALTNVEFTLEARDTVTGEVRTYTNPLGTFGSRSDVMAFPDAGF